MSNKKIWLNLYATASKLKQLAPWQWMTDGHIFAVALKGENEEIVYCCIMGSMGQFFGVNVYLGSEGLDGYYDNIDVMMSGEDPFNILFSQKCLQVTFQDRQDLSADDLRQIKALGLKYRGKNQWPAFRECTSGWYPWYLSEEQAVFSGHCFGTSDCSS